MSASLLLRVMAMCVVVAVAEPIADAAQGRGGRPGESGRPTPGRTAEPAARRGPKPLEPRPSRPASRTAEPRSPAERRSEPARDARANASSVRAARTSARARLDRVRTDLQQRRRQLPGPSFRETRFNRPRIASSFRDGRFTNRQLTQDETYYRYWGTKVATGKSNRQPEKVSWLVKKPYDSEQAFRDEVAVGSGTRIERVTTYRVPKGTWVSEGIASAMDGRPGGGYQAVISNVPRSWKTREDRPFGARRR